MYSNELICDILEYINSNINKEITIDELSTMFFFNKTYIMKRFKREIGITIHSYINSIRVYNSLLDFKSDNYILSIALKHGFNSLEYFSETFKKIMGVSPQIYKKFIFISSNISIKDDTTIRNSIAKLQSIKDNTTKYLNNRKPKEVPVKKLFLSH